MNPETIQEIGYIVQLQYPSRFWQTSLLRKTFAQLGEQLELTESRFVPSGIEFASKVPGSREIMKYAVLQNKIIVENYQPSQGIDLFWKKTEALLKNVCEKVKIPVFIGQTYVIRIEASPRPTNDSRIFIGNMVCGFKPERLKAFKRLAQTVGLRFYFPATGENKNHFDIKIESRITDVSRIWVESSGSFFYPVPVNNLSIIYDNLIATRDFLTKNVVDFLLQYNNLRENKNEREE